MKILDCTLRDGGYYTDWSFSEPLIGRYLNAMAAAGVDMVELGLRNLTSADFKGPFYFTTEQFLAGIDLPSGPEYGVMVDAKTILNASMLPEDSVRQLFPPASQSPIDFVRLACHYSEVHESQPAVAELIQLGYQVMVNLMQVSLRSDKQITELISNIAGWGSVSAIYFADSLGNMTQQDVRRIVALISDCWEGDVGIHAHNNMGNALSNTIAAREDGVTYLDATITGMGRGAGNTETELLIAELQYQGDERYSVSPLAELILKDFAPMKKEKGWGTSLHYYLAARYNIHPTYIQTLLTDKHFGLSERKIAIEMMPALAGKTSYEAESMGRFVASSPTSGPGLVTTGPSFSWDCQLADIEVDVSRPAVVLGAGRGVAEHAMGIRQFLGRSGGLLMAINEVVSEISDLVDIYTVLHGEKYVDYKNMACASGQLVVAPLDRFSADELGAFSSEQLVDYSVAISAEHFEAQANGCIIPGSFTAAYSIAALISLGFTEIYLCGFDGYGQADPRQKEMSSMFSLIKNTNPQLSLLALTPTTYPVEQRSVYAPVL